MARFDEPSQIRIPLPPATKGFRHWGDGMAGELVAARIQGYSPAALAYVDMQVDANGVVQTAGGGTGGGGAVTVADGADVAQGTTTDLSSANTVVGLLKNLKAALAGTLTTTTSWAAAQHVIVDTAPTTAVTGTFWQATQPVSGTFWQATQPVSLAAVVHIDDNAGSVTVDAPVATPVWVRLSDGAAAFVGQKAMAASIPVVVASDQSAIPVSGTVTANQGGAPWAENITQIGGAALALKALPAGGSGQAALPVWNAAIQMLTYDAGARAIVTGALTAGTAKAVLSIEHALASTKSVKIRRIIAHMIQTTALSGLVELELHRGTAASSAGTVRTPTPRNAADTAAEAVVKSLPTIVAATVLDTFPLGGFGATTALYSPPVVVYDWQEAGETKTYILRAGVLESFVLNVISSAAHNLTMAIAIDFTEE